MAGCGKHPYRPLFMYLTWLEKEQLRSQSATAGATRGPISLGGAGGFPTPLTRARHVVLDRGRIPKGSAAPLACVMLATCCRLCPLSLGPALDKGLLGAPVGTGFLLRGRLGFIPHRPRGVFTRVKVHAITVAQLHPLGVPH